MFNFSRKQLNWVVIITVTCIVWLRWPSDDEATPLVKVQPPAVLAFNLPAFQQWSTREHVSIIYSHNSDQSLQLHLFQPTNGEQKSTVSSIDFGSQLNLAVQQLDQQVTTLMHWQQQPTMVLLSGPWPEQVAKLVAAKVIKKLQLKGITSPTLDCQASWPKFAGQHVPLQPQQKSLEIADSEQATALNNWHQTFQDYVQQHQFHIDFMFNLTYYRCPQKLWQSELNKLYQIPVAKPLISLQP